jgi:ketosteroid isomerase-like protein
MPSTQQQADLTAVVERAVEAYNAADFDTYERYFTEDLHFCHHNRGFEFHGRKPFIDTLRTFAAELIPNRAFGAATRLVQAGNVVVREQSWGGTAIADVPGIAEQGQTFSLDLCTVYVFDGDRVSEYHDYG